MEFTHDYKIDDHYISAEVLVEDEIEPTNIGTDPHIPAITVNQKIALEVVFEDQESSISMFSKSVKKKTKDKTKRAVEGKRAKDPGTPQ